MDGGGTRLRAADDQCSKHRRSSILTTVDRGTCTAAAGVARVGPLTAAQAAAQLCVNMIDVSMCELRLEGIRQYYTWTWMEPLVPILKFIPRNISYHT